MSTEINNAGSLLGYHTILKRINAAIADIPPHRLKGLYPDIQRFRAMAVVFSCHPNSPIQGKILIDLTK